MDLLTEFSMETIDIDLSADGETRLELPTTRSSLKSSPRSQLKAVDYDPFADGEILLTAPATESQQEIWVGVQIGNDANLACILSQSLRLSGELNLYALETAFRQLVMRHEALRTTFSADGSLLLIAKHIEFTIPVIDLTNLSAPEQLAQIELHQHQAASQIFDLQHGPLFNTKILSLNNQEYLAILTVHHIICDGWSYGVLLDDLAKIYTGLVTGQIPELAPVEYLSEYAFLEQEKIDKLVTIETETYWLEKFAKLPPVLDFPTDYPRPPLRTFNADRVSHTLSANLVRDLKKLGAKQGASLMTTLLAAFEIFLSKITGQTDIAVGIPTSGQTATGKYNLVGHCVNFLPMRSTIDPNRTFPEYLKSRNREILDDYDRQDFTFGSLLKKLPIARDPSRIPLISTAFNIDIKTDGIESSFAGLAAENIQNWSKFTTFEIFLNAVVSDTDSIELDCQYNTNLFSAATIRQRLVEFENLLLQIVPTAVGRTAAHRPLHDLSLLNEIDRLKLLVEWSGVRTDYPRDECIHQIFEQQVAINGNAIALVYQQQQLTYAQLDRQANQLAHHLLSLGIQPEDLVAIALDRSLDSIIAILATLKAGGTYLPLDLSQPSSRLAFILDNANVSVLIATTALLDRLPASTARTIVLDREAEIIATHPTTNLQLDLPADRLAYVMYTSGSTGQPKGVCIPHRGVVRLVKNTDYIDFSPQQVWLQLAPLAFDASTFEIWGSLLNGAKLVLFPAAKPSLVQLGKIIVSEQITTLWLTAGLFHLMVDERLADLKPLKQLIAGGDVLSVSHVQKVLSTLTNCQLINGYGPTENTTFTCCYRMSRTQAHTGSSSIPIGRPIANTQVYILDADLQPVPIGVAGELHIGGDGLARGYLNRPDLDAQKFIAHPLAEVGRLYKTGDRARYLPDGNIEFLGRIDNQVKIRGFRIELGEVEATLANHPSVREVKVIVREDRPGDKRLVAYIIARANQISDRDLRAFLLARLPDYLIPSAFVPIDLFPLTPNGKVDRGALPIPTTDLQPDTNTFVAPRNEIERQLVQIWERVLDVRPIGVTDNFFELGGHSMIAVRLFNEIEKVVGKNILLSTLFQAQTIAELAVVCSPQAANPTNWEFLVEMKRGNPDKAPLFCIHAIWGNILFYRNFTKYLDTDRPIYGVQSRGLNGNQTPCTSIPEMAANYVREIRSLQPQGPYLILGFSLGGLIALEVAQQLQAEGQTIQLLALLDPTSPNLMELNAELKTIANTSILTKTTDHIRRLLKLSLSDKITYVKERLYWNLKLGRANFLYKAYLRYIKGAITELRLMEVYWANYLTQDTYLPQPYIGKISLFLVEDPGIGGEDNSEAEWGFLASEGITVELFPGAHIEIMEEPNVRMLCAKFNSYLK
ncbi:amino acid adenylation domain-containing protein [Chamaesiphon sp. VAR_48_metabat_403]|uniref:non-ribosomal peptide synthetase n=1 Tax=Chamaesiphon sp. VAR_48_metabat_403 TaxID=2964700 RepID=UPI00286DCDF4|nr:amino acid adenylation domain-containing protein [Chamaesiphon sp. VAR_48_metabat_403]